MSNYEDKLTKLLSKCYDDIAAWVKTNFNSVESDDVTDVLTYHKTLPEPQVVRHIDPDDKEIVSVTITEILYMDYGGCGSIYLNGNIPIEELIDNDVCCLADYVNSFE